MLLALIAVLVHKAGPDAACCPPELIPGLCMAAGLCLSGKDSSFVLVKAPVGLFLSRSPWMAAEPSSTFTSPQFDVIYKRDEHAHAHCPLFQVTDKDFKQDRPRIYPAVHHFLPAYRQSTTHSPQLSEPKHPNSSFKPVVVHLSSCNI